MDSNTNAMSTVELGDLSFVSSESMQNDFYSGTMENNDASSSKISGPPAFGAAENDGLASQILNKRGFGWLLEVEDVDDEVDDKPLL